MKLVKNTIGRLMAVSVIFLLGMWGWHLRALNIEEGDQNMYASVLLGNFISAYRKKVSATVDEDPDFDGAKLKAIESDLLRQVTDQMNREYGETRVKGWGTHVLIARYGIYPTIAVSFRRPVLKTYSSNVIAELKGL